MLFLLGAVLGSVLFNEIYALVKPVYEAGNAAGVLFVYDSLKLSREMFALGFIVAGIFCFAFREYLSRTHFDMAGDYSASPFKAISVGLIVASGKQSQRFLPRLRVLQNMEVELLRNIDSADDHLEPETLADMLVAGHPYLQLVDIRPAVEYVSYHICGARNIAIDSLHSQLLPCKNSGKIVLYSNGMPHPAQARDSLYRSGFENVYILTDRLTGFRNRCLKLVSLRRKPLLSAELIAIKRW